MPRNGAGTFTNVAGVPVTTGTVISSTVANNAYSDVATALTQSIAVDGQSVITASIPMASNKLTGLAAGTAANDSVRMAQTSVLNFAVAAGAVDAITATYSPTNAALVDGMLLGFRATGANATSTPTFAPDGLTARTITKRGGSALAAGDISANLSECVVRYNLANTRWELLNPATATLITRSYLAGLTLSTAGASATMSVAAGTCADSTNAAMLTLAATSKTTSAWALGAAVGGLDTGVIANSTWYHFYVIQRVDTGVVDCLFSTNASAPTMPASYTLKRRIGSGLTNGSAQWIAFIQDGDAFQLLTHVLDVNANSPGVAAVSRTLTTPLGVRCKAWLYASLTCAVGLDNGGWLSDLSCTDTTPNISGTSNFGVQNSAASASTTGTGDLYIFTNTSSQIRSRVSTGGATETLAILTRGWIDDRGRSA